MWPKTIMGQILILLVLISSAIFNTFLFLAGWRFADLGWTYKWYIKTNHGRRLEEKIGKKIYPWSF